MIVRAFADGDAAACRNLLDGRAPVVDARTTVVAVDGGRVVGFLTPAEDGGELTVALDGSAVAGSADVAAALYGPVAQAAVGRGVVRHQVTVPARPDELDAWYELSFGREQAYGVRPRGAPVPRRADGGVTVRPATAGDVAALADVVAAVGRHQQRAPVFSGVDEAFFAGLRDAVRDDLASAGVTYHVASAGGQPVGVAVVRPASTRLAPSGSAELSLVSVLPDRRRRGVGSALVAAALAGIGDAPAVVCDWRTTNRLAAGFWRRWAFEPAAYRLRRTIAVA